jgi:hypothetical protein
VSVLSLPRGAACAAWLLGATVVLGAQTPPSASSQSISPVYEGFWRNTDGTFDLIFGYFNRNWDEEIDVPVGSDNHLEPGNPDQGQPTHFLPRRSQFVFKVRVPADFGNKEVVWTLTTHGETQKAYATLKPAYAVDETVMMSNFGAGGQSGFMPDLVGNKPPQLTIEGSKTLTAHVGKPVTLTAVATDDGKPSARSIPRSMIGQSPTVPNAATGLRLSWFVYRGAGNVVFDPPQTKVWEDRRDGADSPWSAGWKTPPVPPGNRWIVRATFSEPGTYVLRALAHDGALIDYGAVSVSVTP